jgi:FkbM family methyltransferase
MLNDRGFTVHQMALSDYEGEADLVVSESDVGSSLLAPTAYCVGEYPQIRTIGTEKVRVRRLDDVLGALDGDVMIKMDAQGAEDAIIRGGARVFGAAQVVLTEVSFVPLYERSALFNDVHVELTALGFLLRGFRGQHAAAKSGEPLFAHCVYVR